MNQPYKILLIDDHELILWAQVAIIREKLVNAEVYTALAVESGLELLQSEPIDLIVLDIDLPGGNGTKMIQTFHAIRGEVRILIHSAMDEEEFATEYLTAGADGFLSKSSPVEKIVDAMLTVLKGEKFLSLKTQKALANTYLRSVTKPEKPRKEVLITPRESEIINLMLQGLWTKEIAAQLGIGWSTVSTHKQSIFRKLGVANEIQLFKKLVKENPELLDLESIKKGTS